MASKVMIARPQVVAEYHRVQRAMETTTGDDWQALAGARQALAWVLLDNAMHPSKAFTPARTKKGGAK